MSAAREKANHQISSKRSLLCVGLDSDPLKIPRIFQSMPRPVVAFNSAVIRATRSCAAAYKINTAFYEARGLDGLRDMEESLEHVPCECLSIADAKRADIGNTSRMYARAFFEHWNFDAITVAPYMGEDSLEPFFAYEEKLVFVLCLTSNPGSADFEEQALSGGQPLYRRVLERVRQWGRSANAGIVVGATKSSELELIRREAPDLFFLIPGVGAQGGSLKESAALGMDAQRRSALINVSRGIIYPEGEFGSVEEFELAVARKASALQEEMEGIVCPSDDGAA
ncbi:orotidine-5'-phosphate decarboxylase [Prosthecochloris sp. N3]|uniref:Orotidine-5'-phosphate decarboxylase n=1 Tax=Prosthecochloris ethylica TaxID=2743976 RepID=A0ABR9XSX5_9CHLB|nr:MULTISPECIES: orotidine-5'-phosphate decarboxylase [Prosthecochloris]MBF0585925.1 orotidine-5'-phosphate decarboxylase [Prosthecochloris ethylica]MBF0637070.1 orotidine-5'-phosphate decarboxylase [Prosthecochloris ethylica]NUK47307.1 orotidine-5'-phosphate decarboxylase [Prosthecochloris ethylica]RNA64097.1 orotidine-5'-phosphate decarboxylase [Prosthecochloris sp. ZM_2]